MNETPPLTRLKQLAIGGVLFVGVGIWGLAAIAYLKITGFSGLPK